uniref:Uncharacterized protein n=1 Tax=Arundo donax TaxID=35708 RepID=A0A0A8Z4Z6_ARUDO
MLSVLNPKQTK